MHPLLAGLIGAALSLIVVVFLVAVRRGRAALEHTRQLQRPLEASREMRDMITALPLGAVLVGPHDEILAVNTTGVSLGLVRGSRVGFAQLLEQVRATRREGSAFSGELSRSRTDSATSTLLVRIVIMHDDSVLVLAEDETERKRVDAVRRDFVANVSHELKTPIGAVGVLAEAIEAGSDDPVAVQRFALRLQAEAARLAELVNQIIELSRLQAADPLMRRDVVSVVDVAQEAMSRCRERADQRSVSLILAREMNAHVLGDRWQLADAVTNLVLNAINYSDERARVVISIHESIVDADRFVDIKVSDNGIGIKPEDQDRIFERFYRVDYGRSRNTGGTGLGLSLVRHIALAHHGTVTVWSSLGQGSTFTLRLPVHETPHGEEDS